MSWWSHTLFNNIKLHLKVRCCEIKAPKLSSLGESDNTPCWSDGRESSGHDCMHPRVLLAQFEKPKANSIQINTYFPKLDFKLHWRLMSRSPSATSQHLWLFKKCHFMPVWQTLSLLVKSVAPAARCLSSKPSSVVWELLELASCLIRRHSVK